MPTYVYACRSCDDRIEIVQKMSDAPLTECQKCGGSLRKVLFPPAVVYKGSGFYVADYKNGGAKSESSSSRSSERSSSSSESKSEAKPASTESKPETKTEAKASA